MTAETQPLFSPQPPQKSPRRSGLTDERDADSVLFNLSHVSEPKPAPSEGTASPPPPVSTKESSGLVDIHAMLAEVEGKESAPAQSDARESSGLVNVQSLLADGEEEESAAASVVPETPINLSSATVSPLQSGPSLPAEPESAPGAATRAPAPAVPRVLLLAVVVTLLAVVGLLAWKLLQ